MNPQVLRLHLGILIGQTRIEKANQLVNGCAIDRLVCVLEQGEGRPLHVCRGMPVQTPMKTRMETSWRDVDVVRPLGLVG